MKLPLNHSDIVAAGTNALRVIGGQLRAEAERRVDAPELWLSVRDGEGLAGRLESMDEWEWTNGHLSLVINPQDLAVLDELVNADADANGHEAHSVSPEARDQLASLRAFLGRCREPT